MDEKKEQSKPTETLNETEELKAVHDINILVKAHIKDYIKIIGKEEDVEIEIGNEAQEALEDYYKLISATLTYELINILRQRGRVRLNKEIIKEGVSKILSQADALNNAIVHLEDAIEKMKIDNNDSVIQKATSFVNFQRVAAQPVEGSKDE